METAWDNTDTVLDLCVSAIHEQGSTVEDCLERFDGKAAELEPLLRLAVRLQAGQSVKATPAFRQSLDGRLRNHAASLPRARRNGRPRPVFLAELSLHRGRNPFVCRNGLSSRLFMAGLILVLLILSGTGAVVASAQAIPGDWLYPIKRANEVIQLTFTPGEASLAQLHLELADRRMKEALVLLNENRPVDLSQALFAYNEQMMTEMGYFGQTSQLSPAEQARLANNLLSELTDHQATLDSISKNAPQSAKSSVDQALSISQTASNRAEQIINHNGGQVVPGTVLTLTPPLPVVSSTSTAPPAPPAAAQSLTPVKPTQIPTGRPVGVRPQQPSPTPRPTLKLGSNPPGAILTLHPSGFPTRTPPAAVNPPPTRIPWSPWPTRFTDFTPPGSILPGVSPTPRPTNSPVNIYPAARTPTPTPGTPAAWVGPSNGSFLAQRFSAPVVNRPAIIVHNRRRR